MARVQRGVEEWLSRNKKEMIVCPYQPGQLTISKTACGKRHLRGQEEDMADLMKGDLFNYSVKRGLSLCRDCPIGQRVAHTRIRA